MFKQISKELKIHAPFTIFGAITGIIIIAFFRKLPSNLSYNIFYILHPIHVVLSALVTASMYELHTCERISGKCIRGKCNLWILLIIGYIGSIGIATISDSLIPYLGEVLLRMPNRGIHIGFIEKWWLVNPLAVVGVLIACFKPNTKFPHRACAIEHMGITVSYYYGCRRVFALAGICCDFPISFFGRMDTVLC